MMPPVKRASSLILPVASGLAAYAVIVALAWRPPAPSTWMNLLYYLLVVLNSYFSLRFTEGTFAVRTPVDGAVNGVLGAGYAALPWAVHSSIWFHLGLAAFFAIAVVKYATWLAFIDSRFF